MKVRTRAKIARRKNCEKVFKNIPEGKSQERDGCTMLKMI
jgi:hypothetical protein